MAGPEHNPADDVEPTKEEYEAWEREREVAKTLNEQLTEQEISQVISLLGKVCATYPQRQQMLPHVRAARELIEQIADRLVAPPPQPAERELPDGLGAWGRLGIKFVLVSDDRLPLRYSAFGDERYRLVSDLPRGNWHRLAPLPQPAEQYYQIQIRGDGDIGWGPLSARVTEGDQESQKEWFNKVATEYHHSDDIRLVKVTVEVLGERAAITPKEKPNVESH